MKLGDCLKQLPSDMVLIDLSAIGHRTKTVAEYLADGRHLNEEGYEVRHRKVNYGQDTKVSIGLIDGMNVYNEA